MSKKAVTIQWLQIEPPAKADWIEIVAHVQRLERITFWVNLLVDKVLQHMEKWIPLVTSQEDY